MATLIWNAQIYTPTGILSPGWMWIENRTISRLGSGHPSASDLETAQEKSECSSKSPSARFD